MNWPDADAETWRRITAEAKHAMRPADGVHIWGNDVHPGALSLAVRDAETAGVKDLIRFHHGECGSWQLPRPPTVVVCNPPWGQRLMPDAGGGGGGYRGGARNEEEDEKEGQLAYSWRSLSSFLKQEAGGSEAYILSGSTEATKHLKLRASKRIPLTIGGVDCRLLQYSIRGRVSSGQSPVPSS